MGRLVAGKGVLDLIDAMQIIAREHEAVPISLRIAGAGPVETQLRMKVEEYGLAERVQLLGPMAGARKHRLLEQTDVFVCRRSYLSGCHTLCSKVWRRAFLRWPARSAASRS